ncbi:hypothetical protein VFPFJ_02946 [Purpureocillium lilacinum]|uniref:Uncharacterized protein n=1 Tax=Purpureocillium lilacinum TaxID=33203 RepID=A0A179HUS8_PURLI|nr:hypothetical protein VFPFJ_02946 [Purpureocillium lilacinum]OAQ93784.1 hypothetical protein VFPFJ_02946 [Purpureocillium lilacinum]
MPSLSVHVARRPCRCARTASRGFGAEVRDAQHAPRMRQVSVEGFVAHVWLALWCRLGRGRGTHAIVNARVGTAGLRGGVDDATDGALDHGCRHFDSTMADEFGAVLMGWKLS